MALKDPITAQCNIWKLFSEKDLLQDGRLVQSLKQLHTLGKLQKNGIFLVARPKSGGEGLGH